MKIKKEYIILLAIICALSLYLYKHDRNQTHYQLPQLAHLEAKDIDKLEIIKPKETIELNRQDDHWLIGKNAYPADDGKVKNMLDVIDKLKLDTLVSEAKSYNRYDLTPEKRITVKAYGADKVQREFDIGKAASTYRHTFVKIAGDTNVYHARNNFRSKFDLSVDDLRNKSALTFDKDAVNELDIAQGGQKTAFKHQAAPVNVNVTADKNKPSANPAAAPKDVWVRSDNKPADTAKLTSLIGTLSNLTCDSYINDKKKADFKNPIHTVVIKGNEDYQVSIFKPRDSDKDHYPAISSANDYPFLLSKWKAEKIMKKPDDLLEKVAKKNEEAH